MQLLWATLMPRRLCRTGRCVRTQISHRLKVWLLDVVGEAQFQILRSWVYGSFFQPQSLSVGSAPTQCILYRRDVRQLSPALAKSCELRLRPFNERSAHAHPGPYTVNSHEISRHHKRPLSHTLEGDDNDIESRNRLKNIRSNGRSTILPSRQPRLLRPSLG